MTQPDNLPAGKAGLTSGQARALLQQYGKNLPVPEKAPSLPLRILRTLSEPMFILLLGAAVLYFFLGEPRDGAVMIASVLAVVSIDFAQEWKTDRTLRALKDLSAPRVTVLRDGAETAVPSAELVPGDVMLIAEGVKIPADGGILRCSDLCVDESSLTGEAQGVWKTAGAGAAAPGPWRRDWCYAGTLVTQGSAAVRVEKTGTDTAYGRIGRDIAEAPDIPTPLQKQTGGLVRLSAVIAAAFLALVSLFTWLNLPVLPFRQRLTDSILSGITLAMAMIPEEFPVILTVFLSMGAWRLARRHSLVRRLPAVETLGAVSVLCVDKTGTITLNRMAVRETWTGGGDETALLETMGLACETDTYDPMEQAMLETCAEAGLPRAALFDGTLLKEYPFTHEAKRMGHVWLRGGEAVLAAKGSPEKILPLCADPPARRDALLKKAGEMARRGLRVIAVGRAKPEDGSLPETLDGASLSFCGLVGLADPPRESVRGDIRRCTGAGVRVVMITGDNGETAAAVAAQVGMPAGGKAVTGDEIDRLTDDELRVRVRDTNIFSRVMPAHKMRIVRALKENGEVVAMTGDGVNDAPALKYADIGIAMGKRGSEVCREAADLILLDDNFTTIVDTIRDGRRIYDNIRRAVGYVFTIHVPIAFSSLLAPLLGIGPAALMLLPLHVVLLELVIDPTCSIVLERQPAERDIMKRPPRPRGEHLITPGALAMSVLQGVAVFAASFGAYYVSLRAGAGAPAARATGLAILFLSNLLLVAVNCSRTDYAVRSLRRLARDRVMWSVAVGTFGGLGIILYSPLHDVLKLAPLSPARALAAAGLALAAVLWAELLKLAKHRRSRRNA